MIFNLYNQNTKANNHKFVENSIKLRKQREKLFNHRLNRVSVDIIKKIDSIQCQVIFDQRQPFNRQYALDKDLLITVCF